jgi:hypothetical protein
VNYDLRGQSFFNGVASLVHRRSTDLPLDLKALDWRSPVVSRKRMNAGTAGFRRQRSTMGLGRVETPSQGIKWLVIGI